MHINSAMEEFEGLILKLVETHLNAPLTQAAKTHIQNRFNKFSSQYKTPDHPPYAAMIEEAIFEWNEKGGCSEESISIFLQKKYDNLPWAHSALLKHHLGKLCQSGDVVLTRRRRYMIASQSHLKPKK